MEDGSGDHGPTAAAANGPTTTPSVLIIRQVYDDDSDPQEEKWEAELEMALQKRTGLIIIEPVSLGDETVRWIRVGNCLHKTAVLSSLTSLFISYFWPGRSYGSAAAAGMALLCSTVYGLGWARDPCCQYQVSGRPPALPQLTTCRNSTPVVLSRHNDSRRKLLHLTGTGAAIGFGIWTWRNSH